MSRFRKLSQTIWHYQYHIVFVPKYRLRILIGEVAQKIEHCLRSFVEQQKGEVVELNIEIDHVHLLVLVPPNTEGLLDHLSVKPKSLGTWKISKYRLHTCSFSYIKEKNSINGISVFS